MTEDQKTLPRMPAAHVQARRIRALELRKSGYSYRTIADTLEVNVSTAYKDVQASLQVLRDLEVQQAEDVRGIEIERMDRLLLAVWDRAMDGDERSVRSALSIMERRAKLLGLDAPAKSEHTGEVTFVELARSMADQAAALAEAHFPPDVSPSPLAPEDPDTSEEA